MRRRKTSRLLLIPPAHYTKSKTAPRQYGSGADLLASKGQSSAEAACSFEEKTLILQTTTGLDKARVTAAWLMLLKYNGHDECLANHIQSLGMIRDLLPRLVCQSSLRATGTREIYEA